MQYIVYLVLLFFFYAFAGWCIEVTLKYFEFHRFINRGFLSGPVLPVYGSGAALITISIGLLRPYESSLGTTFVVSFILCGILEYLTSFVMEKQFHARWWDYSKKPMNLHGRVWIGNLLLFGLGGIAIIHIINPLLDMVIQTLTFTQQEIMAGIFLAIFLADNLMAQFILRMLKNSIEQSEADNTEEIGREIRILLSDKSIFHRRFVEAYPEVVYRTERINARLAALKRETEHIYQEAEQLLKGQKAQLAASLETAGMMKSTIIRKQEDLINLLYDEQSAGEEAKTLKAEIDQEKQRLQAHPLSQLAKNIFIK